MALKLKAKQSLKLFNRPLNNVNATPKTADISWLKQTIRQELYLRIKQVHSLDGQHLWQEINQVATKLFINYQLDLNKQRQIIQEIYDKIRGFDILQPLISDARISEIMVNGYDKIFYEAGGKIYRSSLKFETEEAYMELLNYWFAKANRPLNHSFPIADLRLPDGSRAHAVIPPASPDGPILNIRKFTNIKPDRNYYIEQKAIPEKYMSFLENAVKAKKSIFICGGTGSGKTTLLNILSAAIPSNERVITIEDACELQLQNVPNLVRLEAQRVNNEMQTPINLTSLIKAALRMRPDRLIVGEVRGEEAVELLNAMNTGHPGTLSTGHSNSCLDMLYRLSNLIFANSKIPYEAIQRTLAASIDYLVFITREADGYRHVSKIEKLIAFKNNEFQMESIYSYAAEEQIKFTKLPKNKSLQLAA